MCVPYLLDEYSIVSKYPKVSLFCLEVLSKDEAVILNYSPMIISRSIFLEYILMFILWN